jgi:hypothetical protein
LRASRARAAVRARLDGDLFGTFPAFVLLAAAGIARAPRRYGVACLSALVLLSAVSIGRDRLDARYAREDLRGAARYLREHVRDGIPVTVSAHYVIEGLEHYDVLRRWSRSRSIRCRAPQTPTRCSRP